MRVFALIVALAALPAPPPLCGAATARRPAPYPPPPFVQDDQAKVREVLTDSALWGRDFNALLAAIKDWRESGESKVLVFPTEAVGATPQPNVERALAEARELQTLMVVNQPKFKPEVERALRSTASESLKTVSPTVHPSKDDDTERVVLAAKPSRAPGPAATEFLAPGLTISTVEARRGQPERITTQMIDSGDERRPIRLKLYHYAGGAVIFAESDVTPRGKVERVILDTAKISSAIF